MAYEIQGAGPEAREVRLVHVPPIEHMNCVDIDSDISSRWRIFLPPKWHNASVLNQDGIMDPNLTLAHILHNTAVVQLHQCVAFPSAQWRTCPVSLPSASSAETCVSAACEISTIAQQFLQQSAGITNPQLSFCLFIAGRVLLGTISKRP